MTALEFIILSIITWRVAYMLTAEYGPFNVFVFIRQVVGIDNRADEGHQPNLLAGILRCSLCAGVWVAVFLSAAFFVLGQPDYSLFDILFYALGAAGVQALIASQFGM